MRFSTTFGGMDAADEPTWTYLWRVEENRTALAETAAGFAETAEGLSETYTTHQIS